MFELTEKLEFYQADGNVTKEGVVSLATKLEEASIIRPTIKEALGYADKLLYIYTSGTTGLPKAAILPNSR